MTTVPSRRRAVIARAVIVALAVAIWFSPVPEGLTAPAWHLFAIFAATIVAGGGIVGLIEAAGLLS